MVNKEWIKSKEAKKLNKKLSKQNFITITKSDLKWYALIPFTIGVLIGWGIFIAILLLIILR